MMIAGFCILGLSTFRATFRRKKNHLFEFFNLLTLERERQEMNSNSSVSEELHSPTDSMDIEEDSSTDEKSIVKKKILKVVSICIISIGCILTGFILEVERRRGRANA